MSVISSHKKKDLLPSSPNERHGCPSFECIHCIHAKNFTVSFTIAPQIFLLSTCISPHMLTQNNLYLHNSADHLETGFSSEIWLGFNWLETEDEPGLGQRVLEVQPPSEQPVVTFRLKHLWSYNLRTMLTQVSSSWPIFNSDVIWNKDDCSGIISTITRASSIRRHFSL